MRPTKKMWDCDGKISNPTCRIYRCVICGKENPWLCDPKLDGSFGELHKTKSGYVSGLSLTSDPVFYPKIK